MITTSVFCPMYDDVDQHVDKYEDDELAMIDSDVPEAIAAIASQGETYGLQKMKKRCWRI